MDATLLIEGREVVLGEPARQLGRRQAAGGAGIPGPAQEIGGCPSFFLHPASL